MLPPPFWCVGRSTRAWGVQEWLFLWIFLLLSCLHQRQQSFSILNPQDLFHSWYFWEDDFDSTMTPLHFTESELSFWSWYCYRDWASFRTKSKVWKAEDALFGYSNLFGSIDQISTHACIPQDRVTLFIHFHTST